MERPSPAYEGTEPYIFVCYAHTDANVVYPEIKRLQELDINVRYDLIIREKNDCRVNPQRFRQN